MPLIVAGLRLASVSTIGLVVITGILGDRYGGLGFFIFEGYRHSFPTEILAGAVPSVVLASPSTACSWSRQPPHAVGRAGEA